MKRATGILSIIFGIILLSGPLVPALAGPTILQAKLTPDSPLPEEVSVPEGTERARDVRMRHAPLLIEMRQVVGVGLTLSAQNRPAILVLLKGPVDPGLLPEHIEGIPIVRLVTGRIHAMPSPKGTPPPPEIEQAIDPSDQFSRPVPIGVSSGNIGECSSGTLGVRVTKDGNLYALSNNHVFALENAATAGGGIVQPGVYDSGSCQQKEENVIAVLDDFERIDFGAGASNRIDAAIALTTEEALGKNTPPDGYGTPSSTALTLAPKDILAPVQKYGRTTGLTQGVVEAIDVTVDVSYESGVARFTNQIMVSSRKPFIKAGDSGSLLVTEGQNRPVGLLFAGSMTGKYAFANPIGEVLDAFGIAIDGEP